MTNHRCLSGGVYNCLRYLHELYLIYVYAHRRLRRFKWNNSVLCQTSQNARVKRVKTLCIYIYIIQCSMYIYNSLQLVSSKEKETVTLTGLSHVLEVWRLQLGGTPWGGRSAPGLFESKRLRRHLRQVKRQNAMRKSAEQKAQMNGFIAEFIQPVCRNFSWNFEYICIIIGNSCGYCKINDWGVCTIELLTRCKSFSPSPF